MESAKFEAEARCWKKMITSISKPKLRQGLSYVLKASQLVDAINGIECQLSLNYVTNPDAPLVRAWYWLPNENVAHDRVYLTAGAVSVTDRSAASGLLISEVLPSFTEWLRQTINLPNGSTELASELTFVAWFRGGAVAIACHPSGGAMESC